MMGLQSMSLDELVRKFGRTVGRVEKEWKELMKPLPPTPEEIRRGILRVAHDLDVETEGKTEEQIREEILKTLESKYKQKPSTG